MLTKSSKSWFIDNLPNMKLGNTLYAGCLIGHGLAYKLRRAGILKQAGLKVADYKAEDVTPIFIDIMKSSDMEKNLENKLFAGLTEEEKKALSEMVDKEAAKSYSGSGKANTAELEKFVKESFGGNDDMVKNAVNLALVRRMLHHEGFDKAISAKIFRMMQATARGGTGSVDNSILSDLLGELSLYLLENKDKLIQAFGDIDSPFRAMGFIETIASRKMGSWKEIRDRKNKNRPNVKTNVGDDSGDDESVVYDPIADATEESLPGRSHEQEWDKNNVFEDAMNDIIYDSKRFPQYNNSKVESNLLGEIFEVMKDKYPNWSGEPNTILGAPPKLVKKIEITPEGEKVEVYDLASGSDEDAYEEYVEWSKMIPGFVDGSLQSKTEAAVANLPEEEKEGKRKERLIRDVRENVKQAIQKLREVAAEVVIALDDDKLKTQYKSKAKQTKNEQFKERMLSKFSSMSNLSYQLLKLAARSNVSLVATKLFDFGNDGVGIVKVARII